MSAMSPMTKMLRTTIAAACVLGLLSTAAFAHDPYEDDDSGYLRVLGGIVRPVAKVVELVVFVPLHEWLPAPTRETNETPRSSRDCRGPRPPRDCSGVR